MAAKVIDAMPLMVTAATPELSAELPGLPDAGSESEIGAVEFVTMFPNASSAATAKLNVVPAVRFAGGGLTNASCDTAPGLTVNGLVTADDRLPLVACSE